MCTCGRAVVIRLVFIVFLSFEIKGNYRWPLETDPKCKMKSLVMFFVWPKLIFFSFDLNYLWTPLWSYLRFSKNVWFLGCSFWLKMQTRQLSNPNLAHNCKVQILNCGNNLHHLLKKTIREPRWKSSLTGWELHFRVVEANRVWFHFFSRVCQADTSWLE